MPWFRKKSAEVIRKGVGNDTVVEERTTRMVGGEVVEALYAICVLPLRRPSRSRAHRAAPHVATGRGRGR